MGSIDYNVHNAHTTVQTRILKISIGIILIIDNRRRYVLKYNIISSIVIYMHFRLFVCVCVCHAFIFYMYSFFFLNH